MTRLLLLSLLACTPARTPPPSVEGTLSELDRIEAGLWETEVRVCRRHAGGRCL